MFCSNCGSPLAGEAKFCSACGTAVKPADPAQDVMPWVEGPESSDGAAGGYYRPAGRRPEESTGGRKKRTGVIVLVVALSVLLLLGLFVGGLALNLMYVDDWEERLEDEIERALTEEAFVKEVIPAETVAEEAEAKETSAGLDHGQSGDHAEKPEAPARSEGNPAYLALFEQRGLADTSALPVGSENVRAFAETDEDGWLYRYEFACDGDIICVMADTMYVPCDYYTEDELPEVEAYFAEAFAQVDALDFCSVSVENTGEYLVVVVLQEDMDQAAHIEALEATGYCETAGDGLLSMEVTAEDLLVAGLIEK